MVFYHGQDGRSEFYRPTDIGREDGQSIVEVKQVKAVCNQCKAEYTDLESIELARRWVADGYAPCPNISCPGQLMIIE